MAAKMTIQTRTQLPVYTAETLAAKNPVLLKGEIVYESDTGRHKLGDGTTAWNTLAYASDVEKVPALRWKVQGGMLYVKPATDPADPILKRCSVGILHYKNARVRKSSAAKLRPTSSGFKLVQDRFSRDELSWTSTRIDPIPFESDKADKSVWLPAISVEALFGRWVTRIRDTSSCGKVKFDLHARGRAGRVRKTKNVRIILLRRSPFRRRCPKTHRRTAQLFQSCCKQLRFDTVSLAYLNILVTGTQKV